MRPYRAILLTLHANEELGAEDGDKIGSLQINRTAMQKLVYFETQKDLCKASYRAHYYGPYSEDVAEGLMTLWAFGYVREDEPDYNTKAYTYTLASGGQRLGKKLAFGEHSGEYATIKSIVQACRRHCKLRQIKLSHSAKVHYLKRNHKTRISGIAGIIPAAKHLGWELNKQEVSAGLKLLQALGLEK